MRRAPAAQLKRRQFVLAMGTLPALSALAQAPADARVKAKLTLTMARFTQWPATAFAAPGDALLLCVAQRTDMLSDAFAELEGQTTAGRPVRVVSIQGKDFKACHVLFVHESAERAAAASLSALALANAPVLTIGDGEGFAARGGMVELVNVNDSIRFDINLKALRAAQIGMSSQVLKLARQVRE
jgi:hypothetical protein